jgi:transcriptional regulator with GAF, ATPase, and Fis domain
VAINWDRDDSSFGAAFDELTCLLVAQEPLEVVLRRVVDLACAGIGECDYASVTTTDDFGPKTLVHSDPIANKIDEVQYANDSGPCLFALRRQEVVSIPSMAEGDSWQPVRDTAMRVGVHSSFSLPVATGDVKIGALNLYARHDHAFDDVQPAAGLLFAAQAAAAVSTAQTHERTRSVMGNLEIALETRDLIGMAKGIIMANDRTTSEGAFKILATASQNRNVKLRDVAAEVIATGSTPD